jgi:hypothetical protein
MTVPSVVTNLTYWSLHACLEEIVSLWNSCLQQGDTKFIFENSLKKNQYYTPQDLVHFQKLQIYIFLSLQSIWIRSAQFERGSC